MSELLRQPAQTYEFYLSPQGDVLVGKPLSIAWGRRGMSGSAEKQTSNQG